MSRWTAEEEVHEEEEEEPAEPYTSSAGRKKKGCCDYCETMKWHMTLILIVALVGIPSLVIWGVGADNLLGTGQEGNGDASRLESESNGGGGTKDLFEKLELRIRYLEQQLSTMTEQIREMEWNYGQDHVLKWNHPDRLPPTLEQGSVEIAIDLRNRSVNEAFDHSYVTFDAGQTLGMKYHTNWTLYFSTTDDGWIHSHLSLDNWANSLGSRLFVRFSIHLFDSNGTVVVSRSHGIANIFSHKVKHSQSSNRIWHEISLSHLIRVSEVDHLLNMKHNGCLVRARFEMMGYGHKIYSPALEQHHLPSKDTQGVIFTLGNLERFKGQRDNRNSSIITLSRFQLIHPWDTTTNWVAEVRESDHAKNYLSVSLILADVLDHHGVEWNELFAIFKVSVDLVNSSSKASLYSEDKSKLLASGTMPLHNFIDPQSHHHPHSQVTLHNLLSIEDIIHEISPSFSPSTLLMDFKLSITVFNKNARFYLNI